MTTSLPADQLTGSYEIDPVHSRIGFVARHAMVTKVRGSFNEFTGSGYFDAADPARSHLELTIKADSIDTRNQDRDNHLRSNDFFDMATYPELRFASTSFAKSGESTYKVTGDLTMKGITRSITIDFELTGAAVDPYGNQRLGLEGEVTVNRKDWEINWNAPLEAGGVLVGEKVVLEFEVSAIKAA
ncbi:MAG: YceI family protein [Actinomycetota bacterium]|jgi:polyisoprenoid-binding protein YceI|nr:YceI family protein [Actinomycetota bacterium]